MKKLFILATALMVSTASFAGIVDFYEAVNSNPDEATTKVDQKAAALKNKIDNKLSNIQNNHKIKKSLRLIPTTPRTSYNLSFAFDFNATQ